MAPPPHPRLLFPPFSEGAARGSGRMGRSSHTLEEEKVSPRESEAGKGIAGGWARPSQTSRGPDGWALFHLRDGWGSLAGQRGERDRGRAPGLACLAPPPPGEGHEMPGAPQRAQVHRGAL